VCNVVSNLFYVKCGFVYHTSHNVCCSRSDV
jgi:hypothetical protein